MSIEFRNVSAGPLKEFTASAPNGAIIGVVGGKNSGVTELLKLAVGAMQPSQGEVTAPPERRFVALGEPMNLAPAAVLALDQALATQDALVRARTLPGTRLGANFGDRKKDRPRAVSVRGRRFSSTCYCAARSCGLRRLPQ